MPRSGPSAYFANITPAGAQKMMAQNTHNRVIKADRVALYVRLLREGKWTLNGDTIRFDWNDVLIDGQHRLLAIIESGIAAKCLIVKGLDPIAQDTIDQGAIRSAGDVLGLHGVGSGNKVAALIRMHFNWIGGERSMFNMSSGKVKLSMREIAEIAEGDELYSDCVRRGSKEVLRAMAPTTAVSMLALLTTEVDYFHSELFFAGLSTGVNLSANHPILTLRNYWSRQRTLRPQPVVGVYLMAGVRCWNAWAEGRKLSNIGWKTPEIPELSPIKRRRTEP